MEPIIDDVMDFIVTPVLTMVFCFFLFTNEKVRDYMNCVEVPVVYRSYETCF